MEYAVIIVPAAPVRRKEGHRNEMVNQLLFGETVEVLKIKKSNWIKLRSLPDNYEGWVTANMLFPIQRKQAVAENKFIATELLSLVTVNEIKMHIPLGSSLPGLTNGQGTIADLSYRFSGNFMNRYEHAPNAERLVQLTAPWLNVPYMWGGRTPLGVDCSGFVQVNYKMMGIDLPRDAWQQAQAGAVVKKLKDAQPGDLAFFDDDDEIVHVGILLNDERIIHASGKVRIDSIDKKVIIHADTGEKTHRLKAIRRFW